MNTQHTPGPWKVVPGFEIVSKHESIAEVNPLPGWHNHATVKAETSANCSLIAAAPDLLAALREFVPESDVDRGQTFEDRERLRKIFRAAIAKAEGV